MIIVSSLFSYGFYLGPVMLQTTLNFFVYLLVLVCFAENNEQVSPLPCSYRILISINQIHEIELGFKSLSWDSNP